MADVPPEIIREILVRSPAETLFRLRSVCKEWIRIIGDSSFIKDHTNTQLRSHSHTLLIKYGWWYADTPLYSFSLDSLNFINGPQSQLIDVTGIVTQTVIPSYQNLFSFCNGLFLVHNFEMENQWTICNPLTGEFHGLPLAEAAGLRCLCGFGFGYDYVNDDYKVVLIDNYVSYLRGIKPVFRTYIYSLKLDSWRKIDDCPSRSTFTVAAFLNGTFYWASKYAIIALDLDTESYSQLPLPVTDRSGVCNLIVDSLDGCLICSVGYMTGDHFDGWVMKDNGVEKSWVKLFSLACDYRGKYLRLVAYLKRKHQVVLQLNSIRGSIESNFLWVDIGNNSVKKFSTHAFRGNTTTILPIFQGSIVRLDGRPAVGDNMKRKPDTRFEFCVRNAGEWCGNKSCS